MQGRVPVGAKQVQVDLEVLGTHGLLVGLGQWEVLGKAIFDGVDLALKLVQLLSHLDLVVLQERDKVLLLAIKCNNHLYDSVHRLLVECAAQFFSLLL